MALAGRSPVAVDQARRPAGQHRRQLAGVPDRRRAADDDRSRAVVGADPEQPPQDVGNVPAEHASIRVQLVDDDDLELLEELEPLGVVGEDRRVEHVRVGDHHLAGGPNSRPDRGGRVPVVGRGEDGQAGCRRKAAELGHLVLTERLGREQEEGAGRRIVDDRLQDRDRVAQGLARGGRSDDHHVVAGVDRLHRLGLVDVRALDASRGETRDDARVEPAWEIGEDRLARRQDGMVDDAARQRRLGQQRIEDGAGFGRGVGSHSGQPQERTDVRNGASLPDPASPSVTGHLSRHRAHTRLTSAAERSYPRLDAPPVPSDTDR